MRNVIGVWLTLAFAAVALGALFSIPAWADDELITACDGGVQSVCVLDAKGGGFTMTVQCANDPARYRMSGDAGITVSTRDVKLAADLIYDIPVGRTKRYVGFALDDGGIPNCAIFKPSPQN